MRRRIDKWDLTDATAAPHHYLNAWDGIVEIEDPPAALRDEEAWAGLVTARAVLEAAEARVRAALVDEPFDEVEVECGVKMWRHVDSVEPLNADAWRVLEARLHNNAVNR